MLKQGPIARRRVVSWEERVLSYEELGRMLGAIVTGLDKGSPDTRFQRRRNVTILQVLAGTGLRASELCRLTLGDVHLPGHRGSWLRVIGGKKRTLGQAARVPVPAHMATAFLVWMKLRFKSGLATARMPLFPQSLEELELPITYRQLWALVKRVAKAAGLRDSISPHSFRHYYITELANQPGIDPFALAAAARLRDPKTALRYIHYAKGELHAMADRVRLPGRKRL